MSLSSCHGTVGSDGVFRHQSTLAITSAISCTFGFRLPTRSRFECQSRSRHKYSCRWVRFEAATHATPNGFEISKLFRFGSDHAAGSTVSDSHHWVHDEAAGDDDGVMPFKLALVARR